MVEKNIMKQRNKNYWADLPIIIMFYVFPFISLVALISKGIVIVNYDYVWGGLLACTIGLCVLKNRLRMLRLHFIVLSVVGLLICFKYIVPCFFQNIIIKAAIMDGKWVVYLLFVILWINLFGYPSIERIYKGGLFFSVLYIVIAGVRIITGNMSRAGILMEANYDGFMILMAYCFMDEVRRKRKWEPLVFIVATFCTLSRTGIACLFALLFLKFVKQKPYLLIAFIPCFIVIVYLGFSIRGESAENLDRFVYFTQAFTYFQSTNWANLLLGSTPGISLDMPILSEFEWTVSNFEDMRDLNGIFPFYFHSTYLRLAFTWGIAVAIAFILYFVVVYFRSRYKPLKWLCVLTLIQSFSLSTLTLPNVSVLFFMVLFQALRQQNKQIEYEKVERYIGK